MTVFLLPETDSPISLSKVGEDLFLLHHNGGTKGFSRQTLESLKIACLALLSPDSGFERACPESTLRKETLPAARSEGREAAAYQTLPRRPSLDML